MVWTYDDAGNITNRKEYTYTTGTLGSVQSTVNYTYDGAWGDLLIGYNGKTSQATTSAICTPTAPQPTPGSLILS